MLAYPERLRDQARAMFWKLNMKVNGTNEESRWGNVRVSVQVLVL